MMTAHMTFVIVLWLFNVNWGHVWRLYRLDFSAETV